MKHVRMFLACLALLGACKGTEPSADGPLDGVITAGNNQTVTAGAASLPDAVAYQMIRLKSGQVALRRVPKDRRDLRQQMERGSARLLDLMLPARAWAQTTVNGSPVPGAVVCAQEIPELVPFARCTNTDNNSPSHLMDRFSNAVPYRLQGDSRLTVQDTTLGSEGARTVTFTASSVDSVWRTLPVTGNASAVIARMSYRLVYSSEGIGGTGVLPRIQAVFCGVKRDPCVSENWK